MKMALVTYRNDAVLSMIDWCGEHHASRNAMHARNIKRAGKGDVNWEVTTADKYEAMLAAHKKPTKIVRNLMNGKEVEIAVGTPRCCDPSSELYHCM